MMGLNPSEELHRQPKGAVDGKHVMKQEEKLCSLFAVQKPVHLLEKQVRGTQARTEEVSQGRAFEGLGRPIHAP